MSFEVDEIREIDYSSLYADILKRPESEVHWSVYYTNRYWIYTEYVVASGCTAQQLAEDLKQDSIVFIKERDGTLGLADSRFVSQANQDVPGSVVTVASDVWRILG